MGLQTSRSKYIEERRWNLHSTMLNVVYVFLLMVPVLKSDVPKSEDNKNAQTLVFENDNADPRSYKYIYETSNGIFREESGQIIRTDSGKEILIVRGSYSYFGPDSIKYTVRYVADENGYRPQVIIGNAKVVSARLGNRIGSNAIKSLQGGIG